jgi:hypothetical protein
MHIQVRVWGVGRCTCCSPRGHTPRRLPRGTPEEFATAPTKAPSRCRAMGIRAEGRRPQAADAWGSADLRLGGDMDLTDDGTCDRLPYGDQGARRRRRDERGRGGRGRWGSGSRGALPLSPSTTPRRSPLGADLVLGASDPGGGTPDLSIAIGHRPPPLRLVPPCEPGGAGGRHGR